MTSLPLPLRGWPEALGWSLFLALGETSVLALAVRGLFHRAGRPTAIRRYRLAWGALWAGAALWAASLAAVLHPVAVAEKARRSLEALVRLPALYGAPADGVIPASAVRGATDPALYARAAPIVAWLWLAVAAVLLVRLAGGWLLTRRIVGRAARVSNERAEQAFRALADRLRVRRVELKESAEVDAPGTVSGFPPSVVFPAGLVDELPPDAFEGLAAHELGHVVGRDSAAALAQAVVDSLLFFCPGVRWLSARVREAREHRCDDVAVRASSPLACARGLGALVERRACPAAGVLGAAGPRLSDRLRRLSQGETTMKLTRSRALALSGAILVASVVSLGAGAAAVRRAKTAERARPSIPYSYSWQQPGAPVRIVSSPVRTSGHEFGSVRMRNVSEETLRSVTFVGVLESRDHSAPVRVFLSEPISASLAPGEAGWLPPGLITSEQIAVARAAWGKRPQAWLGVARVDFAGSGTWRVLPREDPTSALDAFYLDRHAEVSRKLVQAEAQFGVAEGNVLCADDAGFEYSDGAVVPIRDEPGRLATCCSGVWAEKCRGLRGASR